jgi:hypothetical protein
MSNEIIDENLTVPFTSDNEDLNNTLEHCRANTTMLTDVEDPNLELTLQTLLEAVADIQATLQDIKNGQG